MPCERFLTCSIGGSAAKIRSLQRADGVAGQREHEQEPGHQRRVAHHLAIPQSRIAVLAAMGARGIETLGREHECAAHDGNLPEERQRRQGDLQLVEVHRQHEVHGSGQPVPDGQSAPREQRGLDPRRERGPTPPQRHAGHHVHGLEPHEPAQEDRDGHRHHAGERKQRVDRGCEHTDDDCHDQSHGPLKVAGAVPHPGFRNSYGIA